jgi:ribonuclease BN (tRNA processing enzyme)
LRRADKQPVRAVVRQVEVLVGNRRKPNIPVDTSKESEVIFEDEKVKVTTIPLKHRVYTNGYLFEEKNKERKLNIDAILTRPIAS